MMRMSGDIPLDRADRRSGVRMLLLARTTLERKCSVIMFPEGTRSLDGRLGRFNDGAFRLAIGASVPVLPVAVDGSGDCLPKKTWKFGPPLDIRVRVLPPVPTSGLSANDAQNLRDRVRTMILNQVAEWRGVQPREADALSLPEVPDPAPQQF
jgi:1-acyl-sn-glycerol-3-phosphate acyltransferase